MTPTDKIIEWLRDSAKEDFWPERLRKTEIADRLEQLAIERDALKIDKLNLIAMVEELEKARAERDALVEQLRMCAQEGLEPCDLCRFGTNPEYSGECDFECATCANKCPCSGCKNGEKWEWRGAKDNNVPGKSATDTNVGSKEED